MKCNRCEGLCDDDGDCVPAIIGLYYDYQTTVCQTCLGDYLLQFMPDLAKLEIETDVLDAMMRSKTISTSPDEVRKQSMIVNTIAQELVRKVIMWVRAGN